MKNEGTIVLASGGDCCTNVANGAAGTFYEGCIVAAFWLLKTLKTSEPRADLTV